MSVPDLCRCEFPPGSNICHCTGLTVRQAAERVGVSPGHVRKVLGSGRLPGVRKRGKSWEIPEDVLRDWRSYQMPVGRPPKSIEVPPADVSAAELARLLSKTKTYEQVWAIVEQAAPRLASRLHVLSPVLTDAELAHEAQSAVSFQAGDKVRFPVAKRGESPRKRRRRNDRISWHQGSGPSYLSDEIAATLPPEVKAMRGAYIAELPLRHSRQFRLDWSIWGRSAEANATAIPTLCVHGNDGGRGAAVVPSLSSHAH
jgi:excisionase family DNA binding protein